MPENDVTEGVGANGMADQELKKTPENEAVKENLLPPDETAGTAADVEAVQLPNNAKLPLPEGVTLPPNAEPFPPADVGLVKELQKKADNWMGWYNFCGWIYWFLGAASVAFSTLGASDVVEAKFRTSFALLSAICLGVIGFANPQKKAAKFIGAFRLLEPSVRAYKYGVLSKADLLIKDREAENMLNEGEFDGK
ncbi:hypothetical protein [Adhaeribacter rhizoryzae]|uniref:Uncharacterized protein n=1 Tax=Adhaeribacter rhizoryzae TaxID=2607907 RepID=A0A5M6DN54_9BACT|nr:hypothetical protein [Adhaeribacter rhizoryzae]KAA5547816.1 hypothetical protein F0145_07700 [Adhaeribacter rhizoryzae]